MTYQELKNKKITLATFNSFAKKNADKLFVKTTATFDGMVDCVMPVDDVFKPTQITEDKSFYKTGIKGVFTVGSSRDYFSYYEDDMYYGIKVYNCCDSSVLVTLK